MWTKRKFPTERVDKLLQPFTVMVAFFEDGRTRTPEGCTYDTVRSMCLIPI